VIPDEPEPEVRIPKMPASLGGTYYGEHSKREWRRITKELAPLRIITVADRAMLTAFCDAYGRWDYCSEQIKEHGLLVRSPVQGVVVQSPYVPIMHKAFEQWTRIALEFGITPASRSKVSGAKPEGDNADDEKFFAPRKIR
jgi:P27 family predicted phage terminase small subunit